MSRIYDSDRDEVRAGDWIYFAYGTPSVGVKAEVIERDGKLIALTPDHNPKECSLRSLRRYVGEFWLLKNSPLREQE